MKTRSIHFRLTLWYSVAFFISTAIVFTVFYYITKQTLLYQTDRDIIAHAETLISMVTNEQTSMAQGVFNQGIISQQFMEMPGMLVLLTDSVGKITASSQVGAASNPTIQDLIEKSATIIRPTFIERQIGTTTLRIGVFPIIQDGNTTGLVFMGDPVDAIYDSFNTLLITLIVVYGLFAIPTIVGSYYLAKSAMRPIHKISEELKTISSQNLDRQVEVPQSSDEIAKLASSFNDLLQRLHEAFGRERQFIGDVAHELKTPVATIMGEIEVTLSKDRGKEEYKKAFSEILIDINRLSRTIKNILDLAWTGAENASLADTHFDLSNSLVEIQEIASKLAAQKRIRFSGEIEPHIMVGGAEDKVSRAVLNIIDNAMKYTPGGGSVTMSLKRKMHNAVIEVKDTGVGIPEKELDHIFERFYRGSKVAKTLGSGLGLAITQGIIRAHGGDIKVASTVGKGTTVRILIPLVTRPVQTS